MIVRLNDFEVVIKEEVYDKLFKFVNDAKGEVSGFGKVSKTGNKFCIEDIFCPEQRNTGASTIINSKYISRMMIEMAKRGLDSENWRLWWHSHADMQVFFSGIDLDTIDNFVQFGKKDFYMISMVVNKREQVLCRIDFKTFIDFSISNIPVKKEEQNLAVALLENAGFRFELDDYYKDYMGLLKC